MLRAPSTSAGSTVRAALPTTTAVELAMQRSPAQPNAPSSTPRVEFSTSASGMMSAKFFALPFACARLPWRVAVSKM
jgi:hypothetical protein